MDGAQVTEDELGMLEEEESQQIQYDAEVQQSFDVAHGDGAIHEANATTTAEEADYEAQIKALEENELETEPNPIIQDPVYEQELEEVEQFTGNEENIPTPSMTADGEKRPQETVISDVWNGSQPYTQEELNEYIKAGYTKEAVDEHFHQMLERVDELLKLAKSFSFEPISPWNVEKPFTEKDLNKALKSGKTEADFEVSEYKKMLEKQQKQGNIRREEDIEGRVQVFKKRRELQEQVEEQIMHSQVLIQQMDPYRENFRNLRSQEERDKCIDELEEKYREVEYLHEEYFKLIDAFERVEEDFKQEEIDKKYQAMLQKKLEVASNTKNEIPTVRILGQFAATAAQVVLENRRNYIATAFQDHRWFTLQSGSPLDVVPKAPRIRLPPPQDTLLNDPSKSRFEIERLVDAYHERLLEQIDSARIPTTLVEEINLSYQSLGQEWQLDGFKKHLQSFTSLKKLIITDNSIQTLPDLVFPELQA